MKKNAKKLRTLVALAIVAVVTVGFVKIGRAHV